MFDCSPEAVVQGNVDAYNARDLAAIVETYSPDATIEFDTRPDLTISDSGDIRSYYSRSFSGASLAAGVVSREIAGNEVTEVQEAKLDGEPVVRMLKRYHLAACRITSVFEMPIALPSSHLSVVSQ